MPTFKFPDPDGRHVPHASPGTKFVDTEDGTSFSTRKFEMISCDRAYNSKDPFDCFVEHGRPFDMESIGQVIDVNVSNGIRVMHAEDDEYTEEEMLILPENQKIGMPMDCTLDASTKILTCTGRSPAPKKKE